MRLLFYGMQSSGASIFALIAAQAPDCVAFIDIWSMYVAPRLATKHDVVAKVVVTASYPLQLHRERFRPDLTVLVLRHPADVYASLLRKGYGHDDGLAEEKLAVLETVMRRGDGYDHVVYYEDLVSSPRAFIEWLGGLGWPIGPDALNFARTRDAIERTTREACPEIADGRLKFGFGNIHGDGVLRDRVALPPARAENAILSEICPSLLDHYRVVAGARGASWPARPPPPLLTCDLHPLLDGLAASGPLAPKVAAAGYEIVVVAGNDGCRIADGVVALVPNRGGETTALTLSGLPGCPFNRLRGIAEADPRGSAIDVAIRLEGPGGQPLAEQHVTVAHGEVAYLDLSYAAAIDLTVRIEVRCPGSPAGAEHCGIRIYGMCLEHVAERAADSLPGRVAWIAPRLRTQG
jgi:hypothetical protein